MPGRYNSQPVTATKKRVILFCEQIINSLRDAYRHIPGVMTVGKGQQSRRGNPDMYAGRKK